MPGQSADELAEVITRFRRAEAALTSLLDGSARLASVQDTLEAARSDSRVIREEVQTLSASLAKEAAALSEAATALQKLDPDEMRRHLSHLAEAADRLRSRLDEVAGEQSARISEIRNDLRVLGEELKPAALHERLHELRDGLGSIRSTSDQRWKGLEERLDGLQRDGKWALRGVLAVLVVLVAAAIRFLVP